jgi:replicative DNA helicase
MARAERRRSGEEKPVPLMFPAYEQILGGGLWPGVHMTVAGTGVGKTTLALQGSRHALELGVPTLYVGLELDRDQLALRMIADKANIPWSALYTGRASEKQVAAATAAAAHVSALPFECEFSKPQGWQASSLLASLERMRKAHPKGPLLAVVDFLQLVGREADAGSQDLRERIGEAAYMATHAANTYDVAIQLISSTARDKYALLDSSLSEAGLATAPGPGGVGRVRTILKPGVLVGLGKESGEIEYSASSVTVLSRWPTRLDNGEKLIICAVPKLRWGPESWFALSFGYKFAECPVNDVSDLPEIPKGKQPLASDELENRIMATVEAGKYTSKSAIAGHTKGDRNKILTVVGRLIDDGRLVLKDGAFVEV